MNSIILPAEWAPQDAVLLNWPHKDTDWAYMLKEVQDCFGQIVTTIARFEEVVLLMPDKPSAAIFESAGQAHRIKTLVCPTNDTWARDFGPLMILKEGNWTALDFKFNGWGLKFAANKDNLVTQQLFEANLFNPKVERANHLNFVLEGGSIESDGEGTLLTTSECLLSPNRNGAFSKPEIEDYLTKALGIHRVLWLNHGFLCGDDTDSHIDTLARFCDTQTIAYIACDDSNDEHFNELKKMEHELRQFRTTKGKPYRLIALPMADAVYVDGQRLPATYANFLIINGAILLPFYGSPKDKKAQAILQQVFPNREVIGINCLPLIQQNGSLHCVTMQFPKGSLNIS
jgi:agmatine/peptidylarginine deiminase